jgi:putative LysE/RhtB family amino acid efflux pump
MIDAAPQLIALFARTFVIGVAIAAPVGAMALLCVQRTLQRGWLRGMATGFGIATADAIYASLAAFGVAAVSATLVEMQVPLRLIGGAALVVIGAQSALRVAEFNDSGKVEPPAEMPGSAYLSAVGLTLTNPMTIIAFGAVFASAGLVAQPNPFTAATATAGIFAGSLAWWFVLVSGIDVARASAEKWLLHGLGQVSGLVLVGFGLYAVGTVLWPLVG